MGAPGNVPGETNALQVQVPCIIFFVLTPLFVTVRTWSRFKLSTGLGWDDHTLLFSFVSGLSARPLHLGTPIDVGKRQDPKVVID